MGIDVSFRRNERNKSIKVRTKKLKCCNKETMTMNCNELEEKETREKLQNRIRAKRSYDKNKSARQRKRRERYLNNKIKYAECLRQKAKEQGTTTARPRQAPSNANNEEPEGMSLDEVVELINEDRLIDSENTRKNTKSNIKRIFEIVGCGNDIVSCLKNRNHFVKTLENYKQKNGKAYAPATIVSLYRVVLKVLQTYLQKFFTTSEFKAIRKFYQKHYYKFDEIARDIQTNTPLADNYDVPTFDDYEKRVRAITDWTPRVKQKGLLLVNLYRVLTCRSNDYSRMLILDDLESPRYDEDTNYMYIEYKDKSKRPKPNASGSNHPIQNIKIILNSYKTKKVHYNFTFDFDMNDADHKKLTGLIYKWIMDNKKKPFDFFLERGGQIGQFVVEMSRKIGEENVNSLFRHMRSSELADKNLSPAELKKAQEKLAKNMQHSPAVHETYVRRLRKTKIGNVQPGDIVDLTLDGYD